MSQLKFANLARQDLQDIHDYIAEDNEVAAERVIEGNYLILYRGIASGIYIARVLHTKRDVENMLPLEE